MGEDRKASEKDSNENIVMERGSEVAEEFGTMPCRRGMGGCICGTGSCERNVYSAEVKCMLSLNDCAWRAVSKLWAYRRLDRS